MQLLSVLYCLKCMQYKINVSSIACNATALWRWQHTIDSICLLLWMHQEKWVKLTAIVWRKELVGIFFYIPKSNLPVYCQACVCLSHTHAVCIQVYVWGEIPQLQNNAKTPMETNLQSLDEVFSVYGDGTMYKALKIGICTTFILDTLIIFKLNIIILHNTWMQTVILHLSRLLSNDSWTIE